MDLPPEIFAHILSFFSTKEFCQARLVSRAFDDVFVDSYKDHVEIIKFYGSLPKNFAAKEALEYARIAKNSRGAQVSWISYVEKVGVGFQRKTRRVLFDDPYFAFSQLASFYRGVAGGREGGIHRILSDRLICDNSRIRSALEALLTAKAPEGEKNHSLWDCSQRHKAKLCKLALAFGANPDASSEPWSPSGSTAREFLLKSKFGPIKSVVNNCL